MKSKIRSRERFINRRAVAGFLRVWVQGRLITAAEAAKIMRSEGNNKNTPHLMACTNPSRVRQYWVGWVDAKETA